MSRLLRFGVAGIWLSTLAGCALDGVRSDGASATPCVPAKFGTTTLYLRGSLNAWAAVDEYAFQYRCDAYYLNVDAHGGQDFKLADAGWSGETTFGAAVATDGRLSAGVGFRPARGSDPGGTGNLRFSFAGEHTLRLAIVDGEPELSVGPKSFIDPNAREVSNPVALSVQFDSRKLEHKSPFGAIVPATTVSYALTASPGIDGITLVIESRRLEGNQDVLEYQSLARIPMQRVDTGSGERWTAQHRFDAIGVYGYWFELSIGGERYVWQNNRDAVYWTRERGSGGAGAVDFMPEKPARIRRYRQTVFAADFAVPEWAPDLVYYYIFPDRFRNGDASNDPRPGTSRFHDGTVEFHENWNDKPFLSGTGDGSDARYSNDFFGGDIAGIIDKLDYIRDLGANALYITPLFRAASNHKYDTADYTHIDPGFGTDADFTRLTVEAARRGIRVIPDTSLNHTGIDSLYFDRHGNHPDIGAFEQGQIRADSPYASWYSFDPDNAEQPFRGWSGSRDLPELDKSSPDFRRFAFGAGGVMQQWLDRGAAGWRMDVAPWVPDDFWRQWRTAVKAHRADALTIAETWFDASKYLLGDMFDSTMNYIFRNGLLDYAAGGDARRFYANIELMREAYPPQAFSALMNLLSTHDSARSLHVLGDHGAPGDDAAAELARRRFALAVLFQMTFPGAPTVFYGDEVGVNGGDDPFNRGTYPWADLGGEPDLALLAEFKRMIGLRNQHAVLRRGSLSAPIHLDEHVIVMLRRLGDEVAIVAVNNADGERLLSLTLPAELSGGEWTDLLTGERVGASGRALDVKLPALHGAVLIRN